MPQRFPRLLLFAGGIFLLTSIPSLAEFYTDWLWYQEVGFEQVFLKSLSARATTGTLVAVAVFTILWLNLRISLRQLRRREFTISTPEGPRIITVDTGRLRSVIYLAAVAVSGLMGVVAAASWSTWLLCPARDVVRPRRPGARTRHRLLPVPPAPAGALHGMALSTTLLAIAGVAGTHVASGNLALDPLRGVVASPLARRQLSFLAVALFLVLAFGAWLRIPQLLTTQSGIVVGASYVDVHARMPALSLPGRRGAASAPRWRWYQAFAIRLRPILAAIGLYFAVSLGGTRLRALIQRFVVAPNEQVRETPFITHNIAATRAAFALDEVEERAALRRRAADPRRTSKATRPRSRTCRSGTISRCSTPSGRSRRSGRTTTSCRWTTTATRSTAQYRQIMLSARELNSESLPNRTWINEQLTFTHGYGLTLGPVERGDAGRPAGPVHQEPAASRRSTSRSRSRRSTSASCRTTTCS